MSYEEPSEWDEICDLCNKWGLHSEEACKASLHTKYTTDSMRFMYRQGYNLAEELTKKNGNTKTKV
ncbi:hypothetical protein LCGC14_1473700 [marine sediment metagenome]|uniref:Uncharacterized protein n=1 Tax=marine sediment metagenome TaxID=412755 RepID=A0A0F9JC98_9ZZZZ|nr:hypothetical protein [bacterium]